MAIEARVVADSIGPHGIAITTMQLKYPRFIHAEFMTHRVFSRNASSSRAIPVAKMIEQVRKDPAMPIHWGKNQPGMQAHEELTGPALDYARRGWQEAAICAASIAEAMNKAGAHKQVVNRILEPFQHINVIVTATEWENFYELRNHPDAQPEIKALAQAMLQAQRDSEPVQLDVGEWHLPYVRADERQSLPLDVLRKCSVARCARVSYLTHDGQNPSVEKDIELYDRLVGSRPIHASPTEHQATPTQPSSWSGNLHGWFQFRKIIEEGFKS